MWLLPRIHSPSARQTPRDYVVREFGAIGGASQTLERPAEHLAGK